MDPSASNLKVVHLGENINVTATQDHLDAIKNKVMKLNITIQISSERPVLSPTLDLFLIRQMMKSKPFKICYQFRRE